MPTDFTDDDELDIPRMARRFLDNVLDHERDLREQIKLRLQMYVGEGLQWDEREIGRREAQKRPMIEVNECKPPVDQVETDIRLNPPGPICHPVGNGATAETADVIAGIIRQILYASDGPRCAVTAGRHAAISGYGVIEYGTRYVDDRSFDQELHMIDVEDPSMWYFDPLAKLPNREDSMMALKGPRILSREAYELEFGSQRKVLDRSYLSTFAGNVQSMFGWRGDHASMNMWTSGGKGPYWVAEFWRVTIKLEKLRMYSDKVARYDSEAKTLPAGVKPKTDEDGDDSEYVREVPRRTVTKYVVDACETLKTAEWIGDHIPALTVTGPETWIEGKLHRGSVIAPIVGPQRALNYTATAMMEIAGKVPRAPFIGVKGQFDDVGDDGVNKWETAAVEDHAWLAVNPIELASEVDGRVTWAPLPQRNMMEAPIQWLLGLAQFFQNAIQAVSSYTASALGKKVADQSGEAIRALQAESNKGTFSYPDGVNAAHATMFRQWLKIIPKIMDEARVTTIIAADGSDEQKIINAEFPHPSKPGQTQKHDITLGRYSVRVDAGPSPEVRNQTALENLGNLFKAAPEILQIPGVAAAYTRLLGDGNPVVDQIAEMLPGGDQSEQTPAQTMQQNAQLKAQNQKLVQAVQQMHQAIEAQLPKIEADKFKALLTSFTQIEVARIGAKVDTAQIEADRLEHLTGLAHDAASQAVDIAHTQQQTSQQQQFDQQQDQAQSSDQEQAA